MLKNLRITDLALVQTAELEFDRGLTVLTGETGAGKSVIVNALALVLGGRADREHIRHRADSAVVEAVFDVAGMPAEFRRRFAEHIVEDGVTIYREIARDGNSRVKINGEAATVARLKELTDSVAEIVSQHANQRLMDDANHIDFLDEFADLREVREDVAERYHRWRKAAEELRRLKAHRETHLKQQELLQFQYDEISKAGIRVGEEDDLLREKRVLDSARSLIETANRFEALIDGEELSVRQLLGQALRELEAMARIDDSLGETAHQLSDMTYLLEDIRATVEQYASLVSDDPGRLETVHERLDLLYALKKKYGGSEEAILATLADIEAQLRGTPPDYDRFLETLAVDVRRLFDDYGAQALALTETRRKAAGYLQKVVLKELKDLAIASGGLEIVFQYSDDPDGIPIGDRTVAAGPDGLETAEILFSANPGEPLKPLVKTASGGEISRVLLAMKSAQNKNRKSGLPLLVFDEVDAGIGGQTAIELARKLKSLSATAQVVVITHLHQIARLADHHFVAEKSPASGGRTIITVNRLEGPLIEREIERMVSLPESV